MKQDNEIDQIFRDASKVDSNEEIPSVFLSDLNARLNALEKKRKKPIVFWWLVSLFSLSLFTWGATFLFYSTNSGSIPAKINNVEVKTAKSKVANESIVIETKSKISNAVNSSTETKIASEIVYPTETRSIASNEKNKIGANSFKKDETSPNIFNSQLNLVSSLLDKENSKENGVSETKIEDSKSSSVEEIENFESAVKNEDLQDLDSTKTVDSVLTSQTIEKVELAIEKKKFSILREIGFFTGVSGIISSIDIPTSAIAIVTTNPEWRETREREEVSTTSWDFSLRMKWVTNGFSVQTGLDYFQWGEQIKYSYNSISGINRYSYLNIPINLGYAKTWNKFGLNPFAGVMFGYGFNRSGNYLQPDLISISPAESKKYLANYQIGCEFYFLSDSQFKFSLIPLYRASLKEVVHTAIIKNRYKSIGLQLGISFNF